MRAGGPCIATVYAARPLRRMRAVFCHPAPWHAAAPAAAQVSMCPWDLSCRSAPAIAVLTLWHRAAVSPAVQTSSGSSGQKENLCETWCPGASGGDKIPCASEPLLQATHPLAVPPSSPCADWAGVPGLRDDADAAVAAVPESDLMQRLWPAPEARRRRLRPDQRAFRVHPPLMSNWTVVQGKRFCCLMRTLNVTAVPH